MKYLILIFALTSCTDATLSELKSFGESALVTCYSGGETVFQTISTGKVVQLDGGGWKFRTKDGRYIQTYADCFVEVKE